MEEKEKIMSVNDSLGVVAALIKIADIAVGNIEYFGEDGQSVSILLSVASEEVMECRETLISLDKNEEDGQ